MQLTLDREWRKTTRRRANISKQLLIWYVPLEVKSSNGKGDPEAANEAAWHWMNGVGCKRSKKQAAKYYRYVSRQY